jgi:hypothetical protein
MLSRQMFRATPHHPRDTTATVETTTSRSEAREPATTNAGLSSPRHGTHTYAVRLCVQYCIGFLLLFFLP